NRQLYKLASVQHVVAPAGSGNLSALAAVYGGDKFETPAAFGALSANVSFLLGLGFDAQEVGYALTDEVPPKVRIRLERLSVQPSRRTCDEKQHQHPSWRFHMSTTLRWNRAYIRHTS